MIKFFIKFILKTTLILIILLIPNYNYANQILIYADNINYDSDEVIVARGKAKIQYEEQLITSEIIIYNKKENKIILPVKFSLKDKDNNYIQGSNGSFSQNLENGIIEDVKILLNDGSRIVGKNAKRKGHIDIITKGVYSPCKSRIKIGNFICPSWQLEGERMLHDNESLFLHQKHTKMRVLNTPIFYLPYMVSPSPLRKERKSGFLTPSFNFNFFDTKTSQSTSLPYYFNIAEDKELTFTPTLNYGGGVDSSQRFLFDYSQLLSGGNLNINLKFDSNLEKENNNKWLSDASIITNYSQNISSNYKIEFESALQTSKNYIQRTDPNNNLNYQSSLRSKVKIHGYNLYNFDDKLEISSSYYQVSQDEEDNKITPIVLPYIEYYSGIKQYKNHTKYFSKNIFYNIFRDKSNNIHAKSQRKLSSTFLTNNIFYKDIFRINFNSETYFQIFDTEKKFIENNEYHTGYYSRLFPILSVGLDMPFKLKKDRFDFIYIPSISLVASPGLSNSNKISNEDSSINDFSFNNLKKLNRYTGSDKLDNSHRLNYGINISNKKIKLDLLSYYEFSNNSNFNHDQNIDDHLSDMLGKIEFKNEISSDYNFRYDHKDNYFKKHNINVKYPSNFGNLALSYLDQKSKTDEIIITDTETLNYKIETMKFYKYSQVNFKGLYDLKKSINSEYSIGYKYFDECFGVNIDFSRKSYEEGELKPQDLLTIMFSFKNLGSYKSSNLAVSAEEKQDIEWQGLSTSNEFFSINE